mgnify:CR=1 FL=1
MKKKLLIILAVLIILYLIGKGCSSPDGNTTYTPTTSDNSTQPLPESETSQTPAQIFDATVAIPGTSAILGYPSKGFYEKGTVVKTFQPGDPNQYGHVVSIQPQQAYDKEKNAEFVTLVVALADPNSDEKTLEDVVANLGNTSLDADAIKDNGHYETVNGQKFFLYKIDDAMIIWHGTTLYQNHILYLTLMYNPTGDSDIKKFSGLNDQLFKDILQHIQYK